MTAPSRALPRFLALYGTLYAAFGVHSPYLPALLDKRGLRPERSGSRWPRVPRYGSRPGRLSDGSRTGFPRSAPCSRSVLSGRL